jgi:hypothetical protein
MQSAVQKVGTQWNANEYQCILNDALNREVWGGGGWNYFDIWKCHESILGSNIATIASVAVLN